MGNLTLPYFEILLMKCTPKSRQERSNMLKRKRKGTEMKYSKELKERLRKNENVKAVYQSMIYYTEKFKEKAIYEYEMGKHPKDIFRDAGFVLEEISSNKNYASKTLIQWIAQKNKVVSPQKMHFDSKEHQFLLAKIAYLEEENKLLKKLKGIEN